MMRRAQWFLISFPMMWNRSQDQVLRQVVRSYSTTEEVFEVLIALLEFYETIASMVDEMIYEPNVRQ